MKISAIIDTYNYARYLPAALDSVLTQELPGHELEVILVDDGSTDGTPEVAAAYAGRVRYVRKENGGQGSAFNAGFAAATGDIFCMLDGDDAWAPGKLAKVAAAFAADPAAGLVRHYMADMDAQGRPLPPPAAAPDLPADGDAAGLLRSRLFTIGTSALAFRASAVRPLLPIPPQVRICPDEYLFSLLVLGSRIVTIPEYLARRRLHAANSGLYGHNLLNPANLRGFITTRETLDLALENELRAKGAPEGAELFSLSRAHVARARVLLAAVEGDRRKALAEANIWKASAGPGYSFFKYLTMLLAAASPRAYAALFSFYDRSAWPARLRRALTGGR